MPYNNIDDDYGGFVLYNTQNPNEKYYFNKSSNNMDMAQYNINTSRTELTTFGRVPYVYYGGSTNYHTIRLESVFVQGLCQDGNINEFSAREQVDAFKLLISKHVPLVLENSQGEGYIVDVVIEREETPTNHVTQESLDYIILNIICTEIGKLYNNITIAHRGTGGGNTIASQ